jgi:hypothetical protein
MAVIPSFGVLGSRNRKVRITELEPVVALDFQEISNRGRKLAPDAIEFAAFLKTYIAPSERAVAKKGEGSPLPLRSLLRFRFSRYVQQPPLQLTFSITNFRQLGTSDKACRC